MIDVTVKRPIDCSSGELALFCDLVREGGEVAQENLAQRVERAEVLGFAHDVVDTIGIAALKRPDVVYQRRVFDRTKVGMDPARFPRELGWVFVCDNYRRRGIAVALIEALVAKSDTGVYATMRTNNEPMQKTLRRFGFERTGEAYRSTQHPLETLCIFIRP